MNTYDALRMLRPREVSTLEKWLDSVKFEELPVVNIVNDSLTSRDEVTIVERSLEKIFGNPWFSNFHVVDLEAMSEGARASATFRGSVKQKVRGLFGHVEGYKNMQAATISMTFLKIRVADVLSHLSEFFLQDELGRRQAKFVACDLHPIGCGCEACAERCMQLLESLKALRYESGEKK